MKYLVSVCDVQANCWIVHSPKPNQSPIFPLTLFVEAHSPYSHRRCHSALRQESRSSSVGRLSSSPRCSVRLSANIYLLTKFHIAWYFFTSYLTTSSMSFSSAHSSGYLLSSPLRFHGEPHFCHSFSRRKQKSGCLVKVFLFPYLDMVTATPFTCSRGAKFTVGVAK